MYHFHIHFVERNAFPFKFEFYWFYTQVKLTMIQYLLIPWFDAEQATGRYRYFVYIYIHHMALMSFCADFISTISRFVSFLGNISLITGDYRQLANYHISHTRHP